MRVGVGMARMVRLRVKDRHAASITTALALLAATTPAASQQALLSGRVWSDDRVPVEAALVRVVSDTDTLRARVAQSNALGFFSFPNLLPGSYELVVSRIGFADHSEDLDLTPGQPVEVEVVLAYAPVALQGLNVDAERSRTRARFVESAGLTVMEIGPDAVKTIPALAENDPVRAIEVLPGVTTVSDMTAAFNVRGGSADQNLILLDGVPIYSPFHLGGIFSVFNPDMVERAELRAGGFPAEYGGRVSSVLTVESDVGDGETSVDAAVSLLSARAAVAGSVPQSLSESLGLASSRWRVSGRRSYADLLVKPWFDFPYTLGDLHGLAEGWTEGGSRVRLTGYSGRDALDVEGGESPLGLESSWGNDVLGASWLSPRGEGGWLGVRASLSRFAADFALDTLNLEANTWIRQASIDADLERTIRSGLRWKSGIGFGHEAYRNATPSRIPILGINQSGSGARASAYSQLHWRPGPQWLFEAGVRLDHWRPDRGGHYTTLSPRFSAKRFLGNDTALRFSAGRYAQFIHSLRNEEAPVGLDAWVLTGEVVPPIVSDQVQLGVEGFLDGAEAWFGSVEGYYRTLDGVVALNPAEYPDDAMDDLLVGTGRAHGADLFLRRMAGRTTGWLSVSYLRALRTFRDARSPLTPQPELTYPPVNDRRIDLDLVLRRVLGWWGLEAGLRLNYGTGLPFTKPLGTVRIYQPRVVDGLLEYDGGVTDLFGPRNGARYPARHRLDISFRKTVEKTWGTLVPYLSVINVYNQQNVMFYFFDYWREPPTRSGVAMFPILPTFGVEISF